MSFPAAIRGKIIFVCGKAIRDSFHIRKPNSKPLADHELTERAFTDRLVPSEKIQGLKDELALLIERLSAIDGDTFRQATLNYRNRANHQTTPYLEIGERFAFAPIAEDGVKGFTFGVEKAITIADLIAPLEVQHNYCRDAVKALWSVILGLKMAWTNGN